MEQSTLSFFPPGESGISTHWKAGRVRPTTGLNGTEKREIPALLGLELPTISQLLSQFNATNNNIDNNKHNNNMNKLSHSYITDEQNSKNAYTNFFTELKKPIFNCYIISYRTKIFKLLNQMIKKMESVTDLIIQAIVEIPIIYRICHATAYKRS
jgi:hypothetical protein